MAVATACERRSHRFWKRCSLIKSHRRSVPQDLADFPYLLPFLSKFNGHFAWGYSSFTHFSPVREHLSRCSHGREEMCPVL